MDTKEALDIIKKFQYELDMLTVEMTFNEVMVIITAVDYLEKNYSKFLDSGRRLRSQLELFSLVCTHRNEAFMERSIAVLEKLDIFLHGT